MMTPFLYFLLLVSCHNAPAGSVGKAPQPSSPPDMQVSGPPDSLREVTLTIARETMIDTATTCYTLLSGIAGTPVGFKLLIRQPGDPKGILSTVSFLAMGDTSNDFLTVLADIYHIKHGMLVFADSVSASCLNLHRVFGVSPCSGTAALDKLSFEKNNKAELYFTINKEARTISFSEKDKDFRNGIINALSKQGK